jgi:hypothetical protein
MRCLYGRQGMEQLWSRAVATSGNRWQVRGSRKPLRQAKTVAGGCHRLPIGAHGKEGVDGSSPSEGLHKSPAYGHTMLPAPTFSERLAGTRRVHFGTGGHSRARATSRDTAYDMLETLDRDGRLEKLLQTGGPRCPRWRDTDHLLRLRGVITSPLRSPSPLAPGLAGTTRWASCGPEPNE